MMSNKILVYIDQFQGRRPARLLGSLGRRPTPWPEKLGEQRGSPGPGRGLEGSGRAGLPVWRRKKSSIADDASLADYRAEPYTAVVAKVAKEQDAGSPAVPDHHPRARAGGHERDRPGQRRDARCDRPGCGQTARSSPPARSMPASCWPRRFAMPSRQIITTRVRAFKKPQGDASRQRRARAGRGRAGRRPRCAPRSPATPRPKAASA